jgi:hypothetical protein
VPSLGGGCLDVGTTPDRCAVGFHAQAGTCLPTRPAEKCARGYVALPGDPVCRALGDCVGDLKWDGIPVDATTLYVDGAYKGFSDGTRAHPFVKVQDALSAATVESPLIAIAFGNYAENIDIRQPGLTKLWGQCTGGVRIEASDRSAAALRGQTPFELHRLTLVAVDAPVVVDVNAPFGSLDQVAITGLAANGLLLTAGKDGRLPTVEFRDGLVEGDFDWAVHAAGTLSIIDSVIRGDITTSAYHERIALFGDEAPSTVTLDHSVLEGMNDGIVAKHMNLEMKRSVITDMGGRGTEDGHGVHVETDASVTVDDSVIDGVLHAGIEILDGTRAVVRHSTIRNIGLESVLVTKPVAYALPTGILAAGGTIDFEDSVIEHVNGPLVELRGASATILRSSLRDSAGIHATGILAAMSKLFVGSDLDLRDSLVTRNGRLGVSVLGSTVTIEGCVIAHTTSGYGELGDAVSVANLDPAFDAQRLSTATIRDTVLRDNAGAALATTDGTATLSSSLLSCNAETWTTITPPIDAHVEATLDRCGCETLVPCASR